MRSPQHVDRKGDTNDLAVWINSSNNLFKDSKSRLNLSQTSNF